MTTDLFGWYNDRYPDRHDTDPREGGGGVCEGCDRTFAWYGCGGLCGWCYMEAYPQRPRQRFVAVSDEGGE